MPEIDIFQSCGSLFLNFYCQATFCMIIYMRLNVVSSFETSKKNSQPRPCETVRRGIPLETVGRHVARLYAVKRVRRRVFLLTCTTMRYLLQWFHLLRKRMADPAYGKDMRLNLNACMFVPHEMQLRHKRNASICRAFRGKVRLEKGNAEADPACKIRVRGGFSNIC